MVLRNEACYWCLTLRVNRNEEFQLQRDSTGPAIGSSIRGTTDLTTSSAAPAHLPINERTVSVESHRLRSIIPSTGLREHTRAENSFNRERQHAEMYDWWPIEERMYKLGIIGRFFNLSRIYVHTQPWLRKQWCWQGRFLRAAGTRVLSRPNPWR